MGSLKSLTAHPLLLEFSDFFLTSFFFETSFFSIVAGLAQRMDLLVRMLEIGDDNLLLCLGSVTKGLMVKDVTLEITNRRRVTSTDRIVKT